MLHNLKSMSFIGIIIIIALIWIIVHIEVKRQIKHIVKTVFSVNKNLPEPDKIHKVARDNKFIYWQLRKDEGEEMERSMNNALKKMRDKKEAEKEQKFNEYLSWCKRNRITPRFKTPHDIDHAY